MQDCFLRASLWDEYRDFLLEPDTPLKPYWRALERFPADYDFTALTDRLWADPQRLAFFVSLQRTGESQFISALIDRFVVLYGLERLDVQTLNIYINIVHLGGDYPGAVALCEKYLSHYREEEILGDRELLHLRIRKLHHSMFYAPVGGLIEDAMTLEKKVDGQRFTEEFNELLFLIGGNLGVLQGDFAFARTWTERSLEFARSHGLFDYESRAVRKYADLLCLDGQFDEALELVSRYVSCDGDISSRYQLYLLGSLGEIWRKGDFDRALQCFVLLEKLSEQRGIPGWHAHALLATANLLLGAGHPSDAAVRLEKAGRIYTRLDQKWGILHTGIVRYGILLAGEKAPDASNVHALKSLLGMARSLQYLYDAEVIEQLLSGLSRTIFSFYFCRR